jgi:hypothetical protein
MKGVEVWLHLFLISEIFEGKGRLQALTALAWIKEPNMPIEMEAAWAPDLVLTSRRREKLLILPGIKSLMFQTKAHKLYRLHPLSIEVVVAEESK